MKRPLIGRYLAALVGLALALRAWGVELDERPANPGEWGYRPDNVAVDVTPPGFVWRPCKDAARYALQVASDEAFQSIAYECGAIPWNAHCPPRPLPAGRYFWRYAAEDAQGIRTPWSAVRTFVVPENAVACPQPTREELAQRMPKDPPRLFFRPEDLPRLRELAEGTFKDRWSDLRARADKLLASPPDTSEPPLYPKEVSRAKTPDEWKKIWWGNRERVIAVADGAALLGFVYRLGGEEQYGKAARDLLVAMTAWDPKGSTKYTYNDEAAMPALYMTSRAYSWAYPALNDDDRARVVAMMRERGGQAFANIESANHLWRPYDSHHNRAWHFLGEVALAFYDDIPEAPEWLDYAMTVMYTVYPAWGDSDGGWHEGTAYWSSYTNRFVYWAYVVRAAFGIDVFERPFYRHVGDFAMYTLPPGSKAGAFGDLAIGTTSASVAPLMAVLANGARNPYWKWYADSSGAGVGEGYLGFLYAASATGLESTPPSDLPSSACFRGVGVAVLNSNLLDGTQNVQVDFKSSPYGSQSHGYNASNGFVLNVGGQRVLLRTGRRDLHGSPHHTKWMWQTKSDNAILVDGEGQIPHSPLATGRIVAFATSPAIDVVSGEAGASYEHLDRWTRRIVFVKPDAILIHDVLDAPEPATFDFLLHVIDAPFAIEGNALSWTGKPCSLRVEFLEPAALEFSQTDQYDMPPPEWAKIPWAEWHLRAKAAEKTQHREFLTLIRIDDAPIVVERTPGGAVLTRGDAHIAVSLERNRFRVEGCGMDRVFEDFPE